MKKTTNLTEEILTLTNEVIYQVRGAYFNFLEEEIVRGAIERLNYEEIALKAGISEGHIRNTASTLWQKLSLGLNELGVLQQEKVNKNTLKFVMTAKKEQIAAKLRYKVDRHPKLNAPLQPIPQNPIPTVDKQKIFQLPESALAANSQFYVNRVPQEWESRAAIESPGGLVKIEGLKKTGKTSLLMRTLDYADRQEYRTVCLDFHLVDREIIVNLEKLLKWLCANISFRLNLPNQVDEYWDDIFGSKTSCTLYFEEHLLKGSDRPIVLALDKVDYLFADIDVALDFFGLLRAWFDKSSHNDLWKKLRLILVYSENKLPLNAKQSPFNVGNTIVLSDFNLEQIKELARKYSIIWNENEIELVMEIVGGQPYSVHRLIYDFANQSQSLRQFLLRYSPKK
ncbi:MAG: AAA-like domain-containing protein [Prochloraceae cyanobacterium]